MTTVLTAVLLAIVLIAVLFGLGFAFLIRRAYRAASGENCSLEWLDDFSVSKYRPMERLLSEADYAFLESQPGYEPALAKKLRSERRKILRDYLRLVSLDFHRLVALANLLVVYAPEDQTHFAQALWKQRVAFYQSFAIFRLQLALAPIGVRVSAPGAVLNCLEEMFGQVQRLTPMAISSIDA